MAREDYKKLKSKGKLDKEQNTGRTGKRMKGRDEAN
jgi:hypothetical protein